MTLRLSLAICLMSASFAWAQCPEAPPEASIFPVEDEDQPVSRGWMEETLAGRKVIFAAAGVEHYRADGSYRFRGDGETYDAPSYRFYENGVRCIAYPGGPRFDYYVMSGEDLVLINVQGTRFVGEVRE